MFILDFMEHLGRYFVNVSSAREPKLLRIDVHKCHSSYLLEWRKLHFPMISTVAIIDITKKATRRFPVNFFPERNLPNATFPGTAFPGRDISRT